MQMWHIFGLHWLSAHSTHTMQLHQMPDMGGHFLKEHVLNALIVFLQIQVALSNYFSVKVFRIMDDLHNL